MVPTSRNAHSRTYRKPALATADLLMFGRCPEPVRTRSGLTLGAGEVYPEINFTLPPMPITPETWPKIREIYSQLMDALLGRAHDLALPGLVVEFEQLPPMTATPGWGAELTELLATKLRQAQESFGLKSALRVTIVDLREEQKPPPRRKGEPWDHMRASLELCAARGADFLSIESTGGKEVHDLALTRGDIPGIIFALGVLAPRDMSWLWDQFVEVGNAHNVLAGGDTACGFANTAMQLVGQKMLPDTLAAVVRALSSVRSLVAYERGAVGPSKDCAYEGPVMKAIAGVPISMEGRSATCAHLSPIGNIAGAACDLWSNESVADVRLLSGPAPIASLESLAYDCRLFNVALQRGTEKTLRDLHVESDAPHSAQAALMTPVATLKLAAAITSETDPYRRALAAGRTAFALLDEARASEALRMDGREARWYDKLRTAFDALPEDAATLQAQIQPKYGALYAPEAYDLSA